MDNTLNKISKHYNYNKNFIYSSLVYDVKLNKISYFALFDLCKERNKPLIVEK